MTRFDRSTLSAFGRRSVRYLRTCFRIDTRSLALFRFSLAILILADLLSRARSFSFYYTDDGIVTEEIARDATADYAVSVFYFTSDPTLIGALFILHAVFAVQLLVGYKTRLATILSFLFVISLDHHNPFVLSYADTLFRLLFFWAIFLPLGERWSIDAVHRTRPTREQFLGIASVFAMGQMVFMYTINGINKFPSDLWQSGEAAILVMGLDEMTFLLGDYTREVPWLLQIGGWLWFHMLLVSALLILLTGRKRLPLLVLFIGGHLSFAISVRIGAFPYVALAGLFLFVPTQFWQDASRLLDRTERVKTGCGRLRERAIALAATLPGRILADERIQRARAVSYQAIMVLIVVMIAICVVVLLPEISLFWEENVTADQHPDRTLEDNTFSAPIYELASGLGVDQPAWSVFAGPDPRTTDRYYVLAAQDADNNTYDVYNNRELTFERPGQELQTQHDVYRMRFFMNSIRRGGPASDLTASFIDHYCETWEEERGIDLVRINVWEITEEVTLESIDDPDEREREASLRYRGTCGDNLPDNIASPDF